MVLKLNNQNISPIGHGADINSDLFYYHYDGCTIELQVFPGEIYFGWLVVEGNLSKEEAEKVTEEYNHVMNFISYGARLEEEILDAIKTVKEKSHEKEQNQNT